jgi:hypothetical protein
LIPITGGELIELSCTEPSTLRLASFKFTFTNLCGYSARLDGASESGIPSVLSKDKPFVGGITLSLFKDGEPVSKIPADATITLFFDIPEDMNGESLVILFWDLSANNGTGGWVEKISTVVDGQLVLMVDTPGTFVVVNNTEVTQIESQPLVNETDFFSSAMNWIKSFFHSLGG